MKSFALYFRVCTKMGKQNSRTFFIFQTLNFFPILYKTTREKIHSFSFILIPVIKTLTTPQIE